MQKPKPIEFIGSSLRDLRAFPAHARSAAGHQLDRLQNGLDPDDWKPMGTVGAGVREIRIWDEEGTFRVVYVAKLADVIYVLHCFNKKSAQTRNADIALAKARYGVLMQERTK